MSKVREIYEQVKQNPGVSSSEIAKNLNKPLVNVWHNLSSLTKRKFIKYIRAVDDRGHSYCRYYVTSKYVPSNGYFKAPVKKGKYRRRAKRVVGKEARQVAAIAVKLNGTKHTPMVMTSRVGIALTMDGKQVVVPVRAAKEVYTQLKEIFS